MFNTLKRNITKATIPFVFLINNPGDVNFFYNNNKEKRRMFSISSDAQFGSNSINTKFMYSFLNGAYIDPNLKQSVANSLQNYNRIGGDWNTQISYYNFNDLKLGKNWGYFFQIRNRMYLDGSFSPDLFNFAMNGNKMFEGKTAKFNNTAVQFIQYQQISAGFIKSFFPKKEKHTLGVLFSYINANRNSLIASNNASIYTAPGGEHLDVDASIYLRQNLSNHSGYFNNNGNGAAVDVFYEAQIDKKSTLSFAINDIGFIAWRPHFESLRIDTSIQFQGVNIGNILNAGDDFNHFIDTIKTYATTESQHRPAVLFLPSRINLAYTRTFLEGKIALQAGVQFHTQMSYIPYFYAKGIFYPHKSVMLTSSIGYGGYTHLNIGFGFGFDFGKGYTLVMQTQNLEGLIPNKFGKALSASIKFAKYF